MTSKSRRGKEYIYCVSCETKTEWFVAILRNDHKKTMNKHWYVCLHCYEEDRWQTVTRAKEIASKPKTKTKSKSWDQAIKKIDKPFSW